VRKRPKGRATRDMQEMPILRGFPGYLRKRFTLAFGEPITIAATGRTDTNVAAASRRYRSHVGQAGQIERNVWGLGKSPGKALPAWNEGVGEHVRTRFHRPSGNWTVGPKKLRTAVGFAPNEENLFLLPDRPLAGENSLK
jgi:hypothetical protein